jgi:hypothetical protein
MDWALLTPLCAAFTVGGGGIGWFGHYVYRLGWQDKGAMAADLQAAASIVRLESAVKEVADGAQAHYRDDAANFARLGTLVETNAAGLKDAIDAMNRLTERIDRLFTPHRGERHG